MTESGTVNRLTVNKIEDSWTMVRDQVRNSKTSPHKSILIFGKLVNAAAAPPPVDTRTKGPLHIFQNEGCTADYNAFIHVLVAYSNVDDRLAKSLALRQDVCKSTTLSRNSLSERPLHGALVVFNPLLFTVAK